MAHMAFDPRRATTIEAAEIATAICVGLVAYLEGHGLSRGALDWGRHMRNIVDEAGEVIAKATDDHTLIGGHHRLALAASLGKKLFWKNTGEPVKLDPFFKGSSHHDTA
jgi:hypothetical protein